MIKRNSYDEMASKSVETIRGSTDFGTDHQKMMDHTRDIETLLRSTAYTAERKHDNADLDP